MAISRFSTYALPLSIVVASIVIGGSMIYSGQGGREWSAGTQGEVAAPSPTTPSAAAPTQTAVDVKKVKTNDDPVIGKSNAPVVIAYWYDFQCPFCKQAESSIMPQVLTDYINTGKIRVVFKDFQFLGADSQTLGQASDAVWQVAPSKYYAWHKSLFENQGQENSGWATTDKIRSVTLPILGQADTDKVMALMVSSASTYTAEMNADKTEAASFGVQSTPSFVIGKQLIVGARPYADIKAAIDEALK